MSLRTSDSSDRLWSWLDHSHQVFQSGLPPRRKVWSGRLVALGLLSLFGLARWVVAGETIFSGAEVVDAVSGGLDFAVLAMSPDSQNTPPGPVMACFRNVNCPAGQYCARGIGDCNGLGKCVPMNRVCTDRLEPVCGCNGVIYRNDCWAAAGGSSVDFTLKAKPAIGRACTNTSDCPPFGRHPGRFTELYFCSHPAGKCNEQGICTKRPSSCPNLIAPVCGCDGKTYNNVCDAFSVGVDIQFAGKCSR